MVWGAVAGTIPDLDVTAGLVADPITNLAFHRCVTHSLYYAALASPVLAWMARALYRGGPGRPARDFPWRVWLPGAAALYVLLAAGSLLSPTPLEGAWAYSAVVAAVTVAYPLAVWGFRRLRPRPDAPPDDYRHWLLLFGLGIATHPLLDCFTTYGTQVFQPFDDLRVAWNAIAVVDPLYTLPFLALVLAASRRGRDSPWRRRLVVAGLALSTAYLAFTCVNLRRVRRQVRADLAAAQIPYERFTATPTLFNNVLWSVAVDQGDTIRTGRIGLFDEPFRLPVYDAPGNSPAAGGLQVFPVRDDLLAPLRDERAVRVATWFSDGYHVTRPAGGDTLEIVDLRFGTLPLEGTSPLFGFRLFPRAPGEEWGLRQNPLREDVDLERVFAKLWERVRGGRVELEEPLGGGAAEPPAAGRDD